MAPHNQFEKKKKVEYDMYFSEKKKTLCNNNYQNSLLSSYNI